MKKKTSAESTLCPVGTLKRILEDIKGKRVTVIGLGLFGGGEGAARFFSERGAHVTVLDVQSESELAPAISRLSDLPLRFCFGPHRKADIEGSDLVVLNPAVPRDCPLMELIHNMDIPIASPMNTFLSLCPAPVAAVTGSMGKSTTTAMLAAMLAGTGRQIHMGGNIGISLLANLDRISSDDLVVLELSSAQLEDTAALPFSPHVGIVTNIIPNHLDRYGDFESYVAAKKNIMKFQDKDGLMVLNWQDPVLKEQWAGEVSGDLGFFDINDGDETCKQPLDFRGARREKDKVLLQMNDNSEVLFHSSDLTVPGGHNLQNAAAAALAAAWLGATPNAIRDALKSFRPLEHRLELCGAAGGIEFYNDSDSTTPDSTIAAINSFDPPITLICGGKNKGLTYDRLAEVVAEKVEVLILLGRCGPHIAQLAREAGMKHGSPPIIKETDSIEEAVMQGVRHSMPGSTVLFSPACSSFDMFQNFAERGRKFKKTVQSLENDGLPACSRQAGNA